MAFALATTLLQDKTFLLNYNPFQNGKINVFKNLFVKDMIHNMATMTRISYLHISNLWELACFCVGDIERRSDWKHLIEPRKFHWVTERMKAIARYKILGGGMIFGTNLKLLKTFKVAWWKINKV